MCCQHRGQSVKYGCIPVKLGGYVASIEARVLNVVVSL